LDGAFSVAPSFLIGKGADMAIKTFPLDDPAIVMSGQTTEMWADGHTARKFSGYNTQMHFIAYGSDLSLLCCCFEPTLVQVSVDNGAWSAIPCIGAWGETSIFSGLTDQAHTVLLRHVSGACNFYLDLPSGVILNGANPKLEAPAGYGAQIRLSETDAPVRLEGGWESLSAAGYSDPPLKICGWSDGCVRFIAKCSSVAVWCYQNGIAFKTQMDGADMEGLRVTPEISEYGWFVLLEGLNPLEEKEYSFSVASLPGGYAYLYALMAIGGDGVSAAPPPMRPVIVFLGDSITQALIGVQPNSSDGFAHRLGIARGVAVCNRGLNGSTVRQFPSGPPQITAMAGESETRLTELVAIHPVPFQIVILYGTNDLGQVGGAESLEEFAASYRNMLGRLRELFPRTLILCLGVLPRADRLMAVRAPWSDVIRQCARELTHYNVRFMDVEGWIDDGAGTLDLYDGVHPTAEGYRKIAERLLPHILFTRTLQEMTMIVGEI
jgi:lysophospholipase L1-like esterase